MTEEQIEIIKKARAECHAGKGMTAAITLYALLLDAEKQEQGEPVAWRDRKSGTLLHEEWLDADPLYTTPQQRTWVGLTDEEIEDCYKQGGIGRALKMLKERNT